MRISNKISLWNLKWGEKKQTEKKNSCVKHNNSKIITISITTLAS